MNWYYERNGTPVGPVTDAQLEAARSGGEIDTRTRLWREGWPEWQDAGEVWPFGGGVLSPPVPAQAPLSARCAECGAPRADLAALGGALVCPACRPRALEKLREGVPIGTATLWNSGSAGPWRDGKALVLSRDALLPECCVKCGAPPAMHLNRKLAWHHPAVYLTILVNLFVYIVVALLVRKTAKVRVPVCAACNARRVRNIIIGTVTFILSLVMYGFGISNVNTDADLSTALLIGGTVLILFSLFWALSIQLVTARKINDRFVWINKAGKNLLDTLPQWPGE